MFSRYIISADSYDGKYKLLFNTKNDYFLRYNKKDFKSLNDLIKYQEVDDFLLDKEFYDCENEFEKIKNAQEKVKNSEDTMMLIIKLTKQCNFRCVYCYEDFSDEMITKSDSDIIIKFIKNEIKNNNFKNIIINWFGGEPTLNIRAIGYMYPRINEICKQENIRLISSITTNGYLLDTDNFNKLYNNGVTSFQVTIDSNKNVHNLQRPSRYGNPTFEVVRKNIENILLNNKEVNDIGIVLRMNLDTISIKDTRNIRNWTDNLKKISNDNLYLDFHPVVDFSDMSHAVKDSEILNIIKEFINDGYVFPSLKNYISINNSLCYAAKNNHYVIDTDLKVSKCTVTNELDSFIGFINEDGDLKLKDNGFNKDFTKNECKRCTNFAFCNNGACPLYAYKYKKPTCSKYKGYEEDILKILNFQNQYDLTLELE